ncbi:hypothetical protein D917_01981 [Trichinella nativa]|uniref:Uncharacterized protein n=1 Tax=Trichinella nativa TaxID=6335 RepID=A0A1Y3EJ69_9BILA|nr:hypothetical protein D917_01981 [Trichinella nativa]
MKYALHENNKNSNIYIPFHTIIKNPVTLKS